MICKANSPLWVSLIKANHVFSLSTIQDVVAKSFTVAIVDIIEIMEITIQKNNLEINKYIKKNLVYMLLFEIKINEPKDLVYNLLKSNFPQTQLLRFGIDYT